MKDFFCCCCSSSYAIIVLCLTEENRRPEMSTIRSYLCHQKMLSKQAFDVLNFGFFFVLNKILCLF